MTNLEFSVPCLFGLEGLAGDELKRMGIENVRVENGRVLFSPPKALRSCSKGCTAPIWKTSSPRTALSR